ncbi:MAG: B12-binding domain-containing radical SAM protein [Thermoflavifilum sp.]|nr:B12-binding domain-containing radical SAM protein [Thermoflavifilum sp.]
MIREKERNEFKIIVIGPHAVNHFRYFIERGVDAVIVGEPELTIDDVAKSLVSGDKELNLSNVATAHTVSMGITPIPVQVRDLADLPFLNWSICEGIDYDAHNSPKTFNRGFLYEASRGCPFQCIYCNTETHRRTYRKKPIERIQQELTLAVYEYGAEYIYFIDESFGYDDEWTYNLLEFLRDLPVQWGCQGNLKFTYPEKLSRMAEAGCVSMEFGLETYDAHILKMARKNNNLEAASQLIDHAIDVGISPLLFLLVGLPGETLESLRRTVEFLKSLKPGFRFSTGVPIPYPNTEYYRLGVREGKIREGQNDESLYELAGTIGNQLCWNLENKNRFIARYGPNVWGTKRNIEQFERDLMSCFSMDRLAEDNSIDLTK